MIRVVQRRLIIPRGDTGTFSVPVLETLNTNNAAILFIFNPLTHKRLPVLEGQVADGQITFRFDYAYTINLPVGKYVWDIKFYQNPIILDGEIVGGQEVDSYYAAYSLPECEIRPTGDKLLVADDAPDAKLEPEAVRLLLEVKADVDASKDRAVQAETAAETAANSIKNLEATAVTLNPGSSATAAYDSDTGVMTLGIPKGDQGDAFHITKTYSSIAAMNADYNGTDVAIGEFVIITTSMDDDDNGKVYMKGAHQYEFIVDMSGVNGVGITNITKTATSGLVDTYTINFTDGTFTTFTVKNGEEGSEYTVLVQENQPTQPANKLWIPTDSGAVQQVPTIGEMNQAIDAAIPQFSIGTVATGAAGTDADVNITGTRLNPVLNFTIPRGNSGSGGSSGGSFNSAPEMIAFLNNLKTLLQQLAYTISNHNAATTVSSINVLIAALEAEPVTPMYSITKTLNNCIISNAANTISINNAYIAILTANTNYTLSNVVITMGGTDVTATVYSTSTHTITIPSVTGNLVIIANATAQDAPTFIPNVLYSNYVGDGKRFSKENIAINFANDDYIEALVNVTTCTQDQENILAIGTSIDSFNEAIAYAFYWRNNQILLRLKDAHSNIAIDKWIAPANTSAVLIKIDKNGVYVDGNLVSGITSSDTEYINSLGVYKVGARMSKLTTATYNYITVYNKEG